MVWQCMVEGRGGGGRSVMRGGGWGTGLVVGTSPEPVEAGDARPACYIGDMGREERGRRGAGT
jgi:hypothetical protein